MATEAEITEVRRNTNEHNDETFSDEYITALVDVGSVDSASGVLWEKKAAALAALVDTTEAGASRKLSDLHKNALNMASLFNKKITAVVEESTRKAGPIVKKIVRT